MESIENQPGQGEGRTLDSAERVAVQRELDSILVSPRFRTSKRSKQFLSYVVQHSLDGNHDRLKERTIGADLFERPADYATGDDPVVRVQAGEVRRRLEQYYHATTNRSQVRIELHVGSYAPEFRWVEAIPDQQESLQSPSPKELPQTGLLAESEPNHFRWNRKPLIWALPIIFISALCLAFFGLRIYPPKTPQSPLEKFWSPVLATSVPVLICMAKPTVYVPSAELYQRHSTSPDKFSSQFERLTHPPSLQPNDKLVWGDMEEYPDYGLAAGDVYAATRLSSLLGRIKKDSQVRIGSNCSFEDLRNFPAVIIGAFNNRWTMQMTSNLHFFFASEHGQSMIREQGPSGRVWYPKLGSQRGAKEATEDYAIITRLLDSNTGQFVVAVAGIQSYGTQAAGECVSSAECMDKALRTALSSWERKNIQVIVQTTVTDSVPGPPKAVALYVW
jgi:hypothetical protein